MTSQQLTLIRHAQGFHNLCEANHQLRDPRLTELGEQQCRDLSQKIPNLSSIDLIVASPIKRTLYTALFTFASLLKQRPEMRIIALPDLQETSALPCDTGSDLADLAEEFKDQPVDLSLLFDGWNEKGTAPYAPVPSLILARARTARQWLAKREEKEIAVVTHGGFLHFLTGDWTDHSIFTGRTLVSLTGPNGVKDEREVEWEYDEERDGVPIIGNVSLSSAQEVTILQQGTGWWNCEYRVYAFDSSSTQKTADSALIETKESMLRRKGHEIPFTEAEQRNLADAATRNWVASGFLKENLQVNGTEGAAADLERVVSQEREGGKSVAVKA